ncbi:hypothetical protein ACFSCV_03290 [Methylopila henanensis]|uniref:Uncharacterized protein n=1 Tax=Methylopila henanensis TaxID=873516 RepID=A0ABW4K1L7_9HYPH
MDWRLSSARALIRWSKNARGAHMISSGTKAGLALALAVATPAAAGTGMAEFWGSFNSNGTARTVSGVAAVQRTAAGNYRITFPRAVTTCSWQATILGATPGMLTIATVSGQPTMLNVLTFAPNAAAADRLFSILVKCQD